MKRYALILLVIFMGLTNCSIDNEDKTAPQVVEIYWNLVNVTGGINGINENFDLGTIIWRFNEASGILTVENNNTDDTKQDALDSGDYPYSVIDINGDLFLVVDNTEIGLLTITATEFVLNENETSQGSGADGYIYKFRKTTVTE
jgi:hypothetical protein